MPDLSRISFENTHHLPVLLGCLVVLLAGVLIPVRRHAGPVRLAAGSLRVLALVALGLVLLAPVVSVESEARFEPAGTWTLWLSGGDARSDADFHEPAEQFLSRLRDSLATGAPPQLVRVVGADRETVLPVRDAVSATGIPVVVEYPESAGAEAGTVISAIDAPASLSPGEAFILRVRTAGPRAHLRVTLDGTEVAHVDGRAELSIAEPGRHVIEAALLDEAGQILQRAGHVLRVGERPVALAVGLEALQLERVRAFAPEIDFQSLDVTGLSKDRLIGAGLVIASADAFSRLAEAAVNDLADFAAAGGGVFITGDGAKYVAPEYMFPSARRLLPVLLHKEAKQPPPDDPPVDELEGLSEITKVSICYVIDNSGSMDRTIGNSGRTRWDIAAKGVIDSIDLVRKGGNPDAKESELAAVDTRVTVISFTLKQQRIFGPQEVFAGSVPIIRDALTVNRKRDDEFAEGGSNTDIYAAIENALEVMESEKAAVKMIVMLTDGADRPRTTLEGKTHAELRRRAINNGINIMAIGIGDAFSGDSPQATAARKVITELATDDTYARIPTGESVERASAIFVEATEVSFRAYDDKLKRAEEERKRRLKELEELGKEPEKVEVMPGTFPLKLEVVGAGLFGEDALPAPAPKVQWLARNSAREGAAVAIAATTDDGDTPALVFQSYGLGRVAFWAAGTDPADLGELTGWQQFPGLIAGSMRWLLPRDQPDLKLVADASPEGIRLLDPIDGAEYYLLTAESRLALTLDEGRLVNANGLPMGPAEVIEVYAGEERPLGDVYVAEIPPAAGRQFAVDEPAGLSPMQARAVEVTSFTREATLPILYLLTLLLIAMPIERLVRRRM